MKLSTKCRYGLRAVLEIARVYGTGPAKRKNIASSQNVSDSYLENILIVLKNNRIIETSRGVNGGYVLSRAPSAITVLEVVNALEGPPEFSPCLDNPADCDKSDTCVTRDLWIEMNQCWSNVLGSYTLQDLLDKQTKKFSFVYNI